MEHPLSAKTLREKGAYSQNGCSAAGLLPPCQGVGLDLESACGTAYLRCQKVLGQPWAQPIDQELAQWSLVSLFFLNLSVGAVYLLSCEPESGMFCK